MPVPVMFPGLALPPAIGLCVANTDPPVHTRLRKLVGEGRTPADVLLEGMDREANPDAAIIERCSLKWE